MSDLANAMICSENQYAPRLEPRGVELKPIRADAHANTGKSANPPFIEWHPAGQAGGMPMTHEGEPRSSIGDVPKPRKVRDRKAQQAAYRAANAEKQRAAQAVWRKNNGSKIKAYGSAYRAARAGSDQATRADYQKQRAAIRAAERAADPQKAAVYAAKQAVQNEKVKRKRKRLKRERESAISPEFKAARDAASAERRRAVVLAYRSRPDVRARNGERQKERYAQPAFKLIRRMSVAVRGCLRDTNKKKAFGAKWTNLVGYTECQLRAHIERQFLPKMGWHNITAWHIDHIVPISAFRFDSADDAEFKAAWALTNLRPIWARENLRKHAKREFLI